MKSATSLTRSGMSDWLVQRASAVILAVYTVYLFGWIALQPNLDYDTWRAFMLNTPMQIFTFLALLSFVGHAWVGMWTVTTDYMTARQMGNKANVLRLLAQFAMAIVLIVVVIWGIQIIWGS